MSKMSKTSTNLPERSWEFQDSLNLLEMFRQNIISPDDHSTKAYDNLPSFHFVRRTTFVPHFTKMKKVYLKQEEGDKKTDGKHSW